MNSDMSRTFVPGGTYFLLGYLDQGFRVPFIQTLIYLRQSKGDGLEDSPDRNEHVFADAIAWYRAGASSEADLDSTDTLWISEEDLDGIKDLEGLLEELGERP